MKCKAKKAFFAGKNDIYHRWKEVKKLNGKSKNPVSYTHLTLPTT